MSFILDLLILATSWTHVFLAPFTKVEESFNLHVTHDVLMYGVQPSSILQYDHIINPGPVKRTFIGSALLAWLATPCIQVAQRFDLLHSKFDIQVILRLVLASANAFMICRIRHAVARRFGRPTSFFFALLSISQFHLPFWMGRTIPNMYALVPVNYATFLLLDRGPNTRRPTMENILKGINVLIFATAVFRAEIALLLAPVALQALVTRQVGFIQLLRGASFAGVASIATSVAVDSYFWQQPLLWPEFDNFYFNVVQGKSSDWGTSPASTYIKTFLPRLLLSALPLSALGFILDRRIRALLIPCLMFIGLISAIGHKEWRFIVYVVPIFNVGAARGMRALVGQRKGSFLGRVAFLIAFGFIVLNFAITCVQTMSSMSNYPGGVALAATNGFVSIAQSEAHTRPAHIHISNLAAQTGASLFLHEHSSPSFPGSPPASMEAIYNKTENLSLSELLQSPHFTHLLLEAEQAADISETSSLRISFRAEWEQIEEVQGFDGWTLDPSIVTLLRSGRQGLKDPRELVDQVTKIVPTNVLSMKLRPRLLILERKGWRVGK
ncbi:glycosyltransferase family 22 protein [Flagelloscypha sp. PMI_526]|nr:glycosyltransferase family 22 protein [Flagelloscypha sp. PMI_526]